ncbi:MAG: alpha/beta hydrolase [Candidatus Binatia bacterium]|nr:alpha/beta hydrolase [Candidatus Binatia bacterium]MDG2008145.1 alpha/beta hydrolase [Candidatus Binatia bacterium]
MQFTSQNEGFSGAPALPWLLLEPQRAFCEMLSLVPALPMLAGAPRGDGHPVVVLPGFMADDGSTIALREFLARIGYDVHGWGFGRNLGPRDQLSERLEARISELHRGSGRRVSLIGWSLGGVYAREIAKWIPDPIRSVVTLGSPFGDISRGTNVTRMLDWLRPNAPLHWDPGMVAALRKPPPRPSTAIYSRTDGVAHWRACCEPDTDHTENIEVPGSHCGLGFNALVFLAIADRLAQPEGTWEPFRRSGWETLLYG